MIGQRKVFCRSVMPESKRVRKETVDRDIFMIPRNDGKKIMQPTRIMSGLATTRRRWNQFIQFRWASTKVVSTENTQAGYISTMKQRIKGSSR